MRLEFISLPPEMRVKIFKYCSHKDWLNISVCNKLLHADVEHLLWRRLDVYWGKMQAPILEKIRGVRFTSELLFIRRVGEDLDDEAITMSFRTLMDACNALMVKRIKICAYIPREGLKQVVENLPNIQSLDLAGIGSGGTCWNHILRLMFLKSLTILDCDVNDAHFKGIGKLCHLEFLSIEACSGVTGEFFGMCSQAPSLKTLSFEENGSEYYDQPVEKFNCLERLYLLQCPLGSRFFFSAAGNLDKLQVLRIEEANISDMCVFYISKIGSLLDLNLQECWNITDASLRYISNMTSLKELAIVECDNVSDEGLLLISKMKSLQLLDLTRSDSFTDEGLSYLSGLPALTSLTIDSCANFTNQGLAHVAKMQILESLSIQFGNFTDLGLHHLRALKRLKDFAYYQSSITDEGVQMAGLPRE